MIERQRHRHASYDCPGCGKTSNAATNISDGDDRPPQPGDFTVCLSCGAQLRYTDDGARRIVDEDNADMDDDCRAKLLWARQFIMNRNAVDEYVKPIHGTADDTRAFLKRAEAEGKVGVIIGTRTKNGPPMERQRPCRVSKCLRCDERIWVPKEPTGTPVACLECVVHFVDKRLKERA